MGRHKGSKNKIKEIKEEKVVPFDIREVKRQLRTLRKLKIDTAKGSEDRHDICRKIRELKKQLKPIIQEATPEKQKLIDDILKIRPEYNRLDMDLYKYTVEQLQKHLIYIKDRPRLI